MPLPFFGFRYITALPEFSDEMLELFFTYCSLNGDDDHSRVYALQEGEFPFGGDQEGNLPTSLCVVSASI